MIQERAAYDPKHWQKTEYLIYLEILYIEIESICVKYSLVNKMAAMVTWIRIIQKYDLFSKLSRLNNNQNQIST